MGALELSFRLRSPLGTRRGSSPCSRRCSSRTSASASRLKTMPSTLAGSSRLSASPSSLRGVWLAATTIRTPSTEFASSAESNTGSERGRVEHDEVVALARLREQADRAAAIAGSGARRRSACPAGMTRQVVRRQLLRDAVERGGGVADDFGQSLRRPRSMASCRATAGRRRSASISRTRASSDAARERAGQVDGRQRLSFARRRARDRDHLQRAVARRGAQS